MKAYKVTITQTVDVVAKTSIRVPGRGPKDAARRALRMIENGEGLVFWDDVHREDTAAPVVEKVEEC